MIGWKDDRMGMGLERWGFSVDRRQENLDGCQCMRDPRYDMPWTTEWQGGINCNVSKALTGDG